MVACYTIESARDYFGKQFLQMKPRLYNTQGCPYAWHTRLVLHEKQIDFDVHEVDLSNKSEEFLSVSPYWKVPVLAVNGKPKIPADNA